MLYKPTGVHKLDVKNTSAPFARFKQECKSFASWGYFFLASEQLWRACNLAIGFSNICNLAMFYSKAEFLS